MNSNLAQLQPYPFQKLKQLFEGIKPPSSYQPIDLHIGEPKHATPKFIHQAITNSLTELAHYPTTLGTASLRNKIAEWLKQRFHISNINPDTEVMPVNGSREALFSFAQAIVNTKAPNPIVVCPNPFYQIYEGAALLSGAIPHFINTQASNQFKLDYTQLTDDIWSQTQLIYVCTPNNPTGSVMTLDEWKDLYAIADRYNFVIAADECYSEIYFDEEHPPLGALEAAHCLGRDDFPNLVVFNSLSKRSNVPGLRSGLVAGNAELLRQFYLYRTYHGCAMNPTSQAASCAAWDDESHVIENRRLYDAKFTAVHDKLAQTLPVQMPDAGFYFWARTPIDDIEFTKQLYRHYNVTVLPGSYLAREVRGFNPGRNHVRIALVAPFAECTEAADRINSFITELT